MVIIYLTDWKGGVPYSPLLAAKKFISYLKVLIGVDERLDVFRLETGLKQRARDKIFSDFIDVRFPANHSSSHHGRYEWNVKPYVLHFGRKRSHQCPSVAFQKLWQFVIQITHGANLPLDVCLNPDYHLLAYEEFYAVRFSSHPVDISRDIFK